MQNTSSERIIFLGRDYEIPNQLAVKTLVGGTLAAGISVGRVVKPNEDALAVVVTGDTITVVMADGHWGREASELAIESALDVITRPESQLFEVPFQRVNQAMFQRAEQTREPFTPETTLMIVRLVRGNGDWRYTWASFGDSCLFTAVNGKLVQHNTMRQAWLGTITHLAELEPPEHPNERQIGLKHGLERGTGALGENGLLLVSSDGLVEPVSKETPTTAVELASTLAGTDSAELAARVLIGQALTKGGRDNIAVVVFMP